MGNQALITPDDTDIDFVGLGAYPQGLDKVMALFGI